MTEYGAESIKILGGLDAVRKVPSMYIGNTGVEGLHHLVYELVDNCVDEALEGYCNKITITIHRDNSVTVEDNGRGIPVGKHSEENMSALEVVLTKLHAGGKFDKDSYKYSAGLHGVGLSVVNALSEYLEVEVKRGGKVYFQRYERGNRMTDLTVTGETEGTGTKVRFKADDTMFETVEFSSDIIIHRMREVSFLNNGIYIVFSDERKGKKIDIKYEGGIKAFVKYLNTNKNVLFEEPIFITSAKQNIDLVEVAIQYNDSYNENIYSYVNNVNTQEGGTHVAGYRAALTRCINNFVQNNMQGKIKENLTGDDIKEGMVAVISIKVQNPQFEGQTKAKLGNSEVKGIVESLLNEKISEYLEMNPATARAIINKALEARRAREAAKKAKELVKNKSLIENGLLPGKLADCQESDPELCELFIVEGDSAGGSAKQGRNRKIQAILPLRGKILNVEKSREEKILTNTEIKSMYLALGTHQDNKGRLRYHKVIIMTDADVRIIYRPEHVLRVARAADAYDDISLLEVIPELLDEYVLVGRVVRPREHDRNVVCECDGSEPRGVLPASALAEIGGHVRCGRGAPTVAHDVDPSSRVPGLGEDGNDVLRLLREILLHHLERCDDLVDVPGRAAPCVAHHISSPT